MSHAAPNTTGRTGHIPQISEWCGIFAAIGGAAVILAVLQQWGFARMGQSLTRRLRVLLLASIFRQARHVLHPAHACLCCMRMVILTSFMHDETT